MEYERSQTRFSACFGGGSSLLAGLISIQNFTGTYARPNFRKIYRRFWPFVWISITYWEERAMLLSTSESLGITVTPRTFLIQSVNMGDTELLSVKISGLAQRVEVKSPLSGQCCLVRRKPKLKLFASIYIVTFIPSKKWSDIRTFYTYSTVRNTL